MELLQSKIGLMPMTESVGEGCQLVDFYWRLSAFNSFAPNALLNGVLNDLVKFVVDNRWKYRGDCSDSLKFWFRKVCGEAESELEKYWLNVFAGVEKLKWKDLRDFPYYENYQKLATWEWRELRNFLGREPGKILFIGSGLPMSAMMWMENFGAKIDCLDIDAQVINKTKEIFKKLSFNCSKVVCDDFYQVKDFSQYDVIVVAALLADEKSEFRPVFNHLARCLTGGQTVLCRDSEGLAGIFYATLSEDCLIDFENVQRNSPTGEIINSFVLAKKK